MPMKLLYLVHVLATVIWVGGMFFAYLCLRPVAAAQLEPPLRLRLWQGVFDRFFPWVWAAVLLLILSGQLLTLQLGGMAAVPVHVHAMAGIGYLMAAIFFYLYFLPYGALRRAVAAENWPAAGAVLNRIRILVGVNLGLGLLNIVQVFVLPTL
ncbi:MAG: CopD family protein [Hydrogenophilaceae bacterium]